MEGYDRELMPSSQSYQCTIAALTVSAFVVVLINSLIALPTFKKQFGVKLPNGTYQLKTSWPSALSAWSGLLIFRILSQPAALGNNIGLIIGIFANGVLGPRFGREPMIRSKGERDRQLITATFRSADRAICAGLGHWLCRHTVLRQVDWNASGRRDPSGYVIGCPSRAVLTS